MEKVQPKVHYLAKLEFTIEIFVNGSICNNLTILARKTKRLPIKKVLQKQIDPKHTVKNRNTDLYFINNFQCQ